MRSWGRPRVVGTLAAAVMGLSLMAGPIARAHESHEPDGGAAASASGERVGLLIADHGEPPEYNEWTYESFREFFQHLIEMGLIPAWVAALDNGTILYDANCPRCEEAQENPRFIDAWLRPHEGPAAFVPASESLPAHYEMPGGPGQREPDIYEHVGLGAWHEWRRMGGRSPNYDEKVTRKNEVIRRLEAAHGDRLAVRVGYGIDPRFGGRRQGIREALDALVNRDRIDGLVVAYHGVGFSDIMQTHHIRHQIAEHLESLGEGDMPIRYTAPLGTTDHYVRAAVEKVQAELALLPDDAPVAVQLSGHGLPTTMCGEYDCGADAYHESSADLFARVTPAVEAAVDRPGRTELFHLYGDGAEGDDDPDDKVDSPMEALEKRARDGFTHVVDIPYEFDANSRDTLIVLRQGYGREAPDWNTEFESHFEYEGMQVKIANANGGEHHKTEALARVINDSLAGWLEPAQPADPAESPTTTEPEHHARAMQTGVAQAQNPDRRSRAIVGRAVGRQRVSDSATPVRDRARDRASARAASARPARSVSPKGDGGPGPWFGFGAGAATTAAAVLLLARRPRMFGR